MENEIKALIDAVTGTIDRGIKNGTIQSDEETFIKWKLKDFKYGQHGVESSGAVGETFTKQVWTRASIKIKNNVEKLSEYNDCLKSVEAHFPERNDNKNWVDVILNRIIWLYFDNKNKGSTFDRNAIIQRFIDDLENKPANYSAEIQYQGIFLNPTNIEIPEIGLTLRQPMKDDLEREFRYPASPFGYNSVMLHPSVIAQISLLSHNLNELQIKVQKATIILRLFSVGSVKYLSYLTQTDSLRDVFAHNVLLSDNNNSFALETYTIENGTERKLRSFIYKVDPLLPNKFYMFGEGEVTHLTIAFERYTDALLKNGIIEERIATSVMGLEALLLNENQELSFKLGLRVARVLSFLGADAKQVRETMKDAYKVRSLFAHGSHLITKERRKYDRRYGTLNDLLRKTLDYLRKLIVAFIISQRPKDDIILLVDDSLIDKNAENQLSNMLLNTKEII
ncbi:MAG: hypothetical protein ACYC49_00250 [Ignavibacteriaceae bacterium]